MSEINRFVFKKKLTIEEVNKWNHFLDSQNYFKNGYYLMNFKNQRHEFGLKKRIRVYIPNLNIKLDIKNIILIDLQYKPNWKLQKENKISSLCHTISCHLHKPVIHKIKFRKEWYNDQIRFTLDYPQMYLEIKVLKIQHLFHFIDNFYYLFNDLLRFTSSETVQLTTI